MQANASVWNGARAPEYLSCHLVENMATLEELYQKRAVLCEQVRELEGQITRLHGKLTLVILEIAFSWDAQDQFRADESAWEGFINKEES